MPQYSEQPALNGVFEPLNTISNSFFIIAGILLLIRLKREGVLDAKAIFLSSMIIVIGIGSLLWHFYRTKATLMMDSIPIAVFVLSYLVFYVFHITKNIWFRILLIGGFFVYTPLMRSLLLNISDEIFGNGGAGYIAAISYFAVIQIYNYIYKVPVIKDSLIVVAVFITSLFFRQTDIFWGTWFAPGTHFLWHTLNAVTLYLFVRVQYKKISQY